MVDAGAGAAGADAGLAGTAEAAAAGFGVGRGTGRVSATGAPGERDAESRGGGVLEAGFVSTAAIMEAGLVTLGIAILEIVTPGPVPTEPSARAVPVARGAAGLPAFFESAPPPPASRAAPLAKRDESASRATQAS
jgi:hypothetical protein